MVVVAKPWQSDRRRRLRAVVTRRVDRLAHFAWKDILTLVRRTWMVELMLTATWTLTWRPERPDDRPNTSRCVSAYQLEHDHHRKSWLLNICRDQEQAGVLRYRPLWHPPVGYFSVENFSSVLIERKPIWVKLDMFRLNRDRSTDGVVAFLRSIYSITDIFKDGGALCNLSRSWTQASVISTAALPATFWVQYDWCIIKQWSVSSSLIVKPQISHESFTSLYTRTWKSI